MSLLLGGSHMQQQCMRAQRAAEAQPIRQAVQSCRVPRAQLLQQHALVSRPQQQESSHSRCVAACAAQIVLLSGLLLLLPQLEAAAWTSACVGRAAGFLQPLQARRRSPVIAPDISFGRGEEQGFVDLYNYLLRQRIIFLSGYVNDKLSTQIVGSLLALEAMDEEAPIRLYINSPGGTPYSVIGVVDAMQQVKCPIQTVALGACYSYSSLILAAGQKGQRFSMKNTRIMMTQPMGGSQGDIYAIAATVAELNAIYQLFAKYYMKFTDMSVDEIEQQTCRDTFMTPEQAQDWGLIDDVYVSEGDMVTPPAVANTLKELGFVDRLSGGVLRTGVV